MGQHSKPVSIPAVPPEQPRDQDVAAYFQPFVRTSPPWDAYEYARTAICAVFLLPLRLAFFCLCAGLCGLIASAATAGIGRRNGRDLVEKPRAPWRRLLLRLLVPVVRAMLFVSFGIYHIKTQKRPFPLRSQLADPSATRVAVNGDYVSASGDEDDHRRQQASLCAGEAPSDIPAFPSSTALPHVLVANHLGYLDILTLFVKYPGSFVSKGDLETSPIVGAVGRAIQCLFIREGEPLTPRLVERVRSTEACHRAKACTGCGTCLRRLIVFPEGTTTNGTAMIPFRTGVFLAGQPVLPVCVQFPHKHFNLSWESIRLREHLFRSMTQFKNNVILTELPVYLPDAAERADARLYASRVQAVMAQYLDLPIVPLNRRHKLLYHARILGQVTSNHDLLVRASQIATEDDLLQNPCSDYSPKVSLVKSDK
jgi:1-acyl-sn-glycerol-3-phosphate acyltransferase